MTFFSPGLYDRRIEIELKGRAELVEFFMEVIRNGVREWNEKKRFSLEAE